jgi:hypothetical protein
MSIAKRLMWIDTAFELATEKIGETPILICVKKEPEFSFQFACFNGDIVARG